MSTNPYRLLTGKFFVRFDERHNSAQPQPDGDTIRFIPDNPFELLDASKFEKGGFNGPDITEFGISVRFEAIDALETHYANSHQNIELGNAAKVKMMELLGFCKVECNDQKNPNVVTIAEKNPVEGFVISNGIDGNGRLIGFVFSGKTCDVDASLAKAQKKSVPKLPSGQNVVYGLPGAPVVELTISIAEKSVNLQLIRAGLVYATLYTSLPLPIGRAVAEAVRKTRTAGGKEMLWAHENVNTVKAFTWDKTIEGLESTVMFPKLYRRLVAFAESHRQAEKKLLFMKWLTDKKSAKDRNDRMLLPPSKAYKNPPHCEFGNMSDLLIVDETEKSLTLQLKWEPEDIIILPDSV